jgi:hypothetical protein
VYLYLVGLAIGELLVAFLVLPTIQDAFHGERLP